MADEAKLILETQALWFEPRRLRQMLLAVDGSGSGIDADTLDGYDSSEFARLSTSVSFASTVSVATSLTVPIVKPSSDSTTAVKIQNAAGSSNVLVVDTTNKRVSLPGSSYAAPINAPFQVQIDGNGRAFVLSNSATEYTDFVSGGVVKGMRGFGTVPFTVQNDGAVFLRPGSSYDIYFQYASTEYFRFTSAGRFACGHNSTASAVADLAASSTARSSLRIRSGTAPTTPNAGDMWFDGTNLKFYDGTTTHTIV